MFLRQVHISKDTYMHLTEDYGVEAGNGGSRDAFLKEKNIETYLISPQFQNSFSDLNNSTYELVRFYILKKF